jgi:hypothetical protein
MPHFLVSPPVAASDISRRVILLGVAVLLAFVGGALAIGYLLGSYQRAGNGRLARAAADSMSYQPVRIKGQAVFESAAGEVVGDGQAAVIVLPEGKPLLPLPQLEQLGPAASAPDENHPALVAIRRVGGQYARCQANGSFDVAVSAPGTFRMLVISRHMNRPANASLDDLDAREMGAALPGIDKAIGAHRYWWLKVDVPPGGHTAGIHFGPSPGRPL